MPFHNAFLKRGAQAFTLIELLAVIAIISREIEDRLKLALISSRWITRERAFRPLPMSEPFS